MTSICPTVHTSSGPIRGIDDGDGILRFLGVPYAQPPVGSLRFRPPQPVEPWNTVLDCNQFGQAAAQVYDAHEASLADFGVQLGVGETTPAWVGSEDCLTLNVWAPGLKGAKKPVFVWIHGGANWLESSRLSCYDGSCISKRGDVLVVSINYRLGIFGFLDLSGVCGENYRGTHSNGLRDQLLALQWIKDNAEHFGGDPTKITLAGESAGSMNISWLATTGQLSNLVSGIVMMSGVASVIGVGDDHQSSGHSENEGRARAKVFLDQLGLNTEQSLKAATTAEILNRQAKLVQKSDVLFDMDTLFYPRVDHDLTLCNPFEVAAKDFLVGVNVMIGYTAYEMGLWLLWDPELDKRDTGSMAARLPNFPRKCVQSAADFYDDIYMDESSGARAMHFLGDACFVMPSMLLAEQLAERGINVWMYQFDWTGGDNRRRALHAADQGFFFGTLNSAGAKMITGTPRDTTDANERDMLSKSMQECLVAFIHNGDPNIQALGPWPRFNGQHSVMHFDTPNSLNQMGQITKRWEWWRDNAYTNFALKAKDVTRVQS